jgi:hypothetical protein
MTLTVPMLRAIPLLVLGGGIFVLLALTDVPTDRTAATPERVDVAGLYASAPAGARDPSACVDTVQPDCVIDVPASLIAAGP